MTLSNDILVKSNTHSTSVLGISISGVGDHCEKCIANRLKGIHENSEQGFAATLGTIFHDYMYRQAKKQKIPGLILEKRVSPGKIGRYKLFGNLDKYDPRTKTVTDYKLLGKKKIDKYKFEVKNNIVKDKTLLKYIIQANLYGLGVENLGYEVERLCLEMYPRDATIELVKDVPFYLEFNYKKELALKAISRVQQIYDNLDVDYVSDEDCYVCNISRFIVRK